MPTADDPESLTAALDGARGLLSVRSAKSVNSTTEKSGISRRNEKADCQNEKLEDSRFIAIQLLRQGLSLVPTDSDNELVNQARQMLAYLLYQQDQYRKLRWSVCF